MHEQEHACMTACVEVIEHVCVYAYAYVCTCKCACLCVSVCACACVCVCVYVCATQAFSSCMYNSLSV